MQLRERFRLAQTVGQSCGILLNLLFVLFTLKRRVGTQSTTVLLRCQSVLDIGVMIFNLLTLQYLSLLPQPNQDSSDTLWYVYCYGAYNQIFYWSFVSMSVYNLIGISVERCLCLCLPFWYKTREKKVLKWLLVITVISAFTVEFPYCIVVNKYVKTPLDNGTEPVKRCVFGDADRVVKSGFGIAYVLLFWILPFFILLILYAFIVVSIRRSMTMSSSSGDGSKVSAAAIRLTVTTGATSLAFVLLFAMDSIAYLKFNLGIDESRIEFQEHLDSFLVSMNSAVNPIIYLIFMPQFRQFLFACFANNDQPAAASTTSVTSAAK